MTDYERQAILSAAIKAAREDRATEVARIRRLSGGDLTLSIAADAFGLVPARKPRQEA